MAMRMPARCREEAPDGPDAAPPGTVEGWRLTWRQSLKATAGGLRARSYRPTTSPSAPPTVPGIACRTRTVSWMVVLADEVWNVLVGHDAVYRRGPEQNARTNTTHVQRRRHRTPGLAAPSQVGGVSSGPRDALRRTRYPIGEHRLWHDVAYCGAADETTRASSALADAAGTGPRALLGRALPEDVELKSPSVIGMAFAPFSWMDLRAPASCVTPPSSMRNHKESRSRLANLWREGPGRWESSLSSVEARVALVQPIARSVSTDRTSGGRLDSMADATLRRAVGIDRARTCPPTP
jgi:hypothetical protein